MPGLALYFAFAAVLTQVPPADAGPPSPPTLNQKVFAFAKGQLGRKVGDGECISLATEALRAAGAKRFPFTPSGDYVWGRPVDGFKHALPGDVVQFRDAVYRGRSNLSGGRSITWRYEYPHHTAIVSDVKEGGRVVTLLHQNVGGPKADEAVKRRVQAGEIRPDSLRPGGKVWIFRPIAADTADTPSGP